MKNETEKQIILLAGLPATGKDTIAETFQNKNYQQITYSENILKPIIKNPKKHLTKYINQTIPNTPKTKINKLTKQIKYYKKNQSGRNLYITTAQYLNKTISKLTKNKHNHFSLFATTHYKNHNKIIISGFRQQTELETLKIIYPTANIQTILITCPDKMRYQRLKKRDNITNQTIKENEKYELQTTYNKLIKQTKFTHTIKNNTTLENLQLQINKILT